MSMPRYVRGVRTCAPTVRVTGRPDRWISAASCTPVADAPDPRQQLEAAMLEIKRVNVGQEGMLERVLVAQRLKQC